MRSTIVVLALVALSFMASGCQGEAIEIADVNARNALDNAAKANSRADDLESEVEELKARVEELENAQE